MFVYYDIKYTPDKPLKLSRFTLENKLNTSITNVKNWKGKFFNFKDDQYYEAKEEYNNFISQEQKKYSKLDRKKRETFDQRLERKYNKYIKKYQKLNANINIYQKTKNENISSYLVNIRNYNFQQKYEKVSNETYNDYIIRRYNETANLRQIRCGEIEYRDLYNRVKSIRTYDIHRNKRNK